MITTPDLYLSMRNSYKNITMMAMARGRAILLPAFPKFADLIHTSCFTLGRHAR